MSSPSGCFRLRITVEGSADGKEELKFHLKLDSNCTVAQLRGCIESRYSTLCKYDAEISFLFFFFFFI